MAKARSPPTNGENVFLTDKGQAALAQLRYEPRHFVL